VVPVCLSSPGCCAGRGLLSLARQPITSGALPGFHCPPNLGQVNAANIARILKINAQAPVKGFASFTPISKTFGIQTWLRNLFEPAIETIGIEL
jgi:hypothetical protein